MKKRKWSGLTPGALLPGIVLLILIMSISSCDSGITNRLVSSDSLAEVTSISNSSEIISTLDYSAEITEITDNVEFSFTSNVDSVWVDVHYTTNDGSQMNHRMSLISDNTWTQTITEYTISTGDSISCYFTYENAGLAYNTDTTTYIVGSSSDDTTDDTSNDTTDDNSDTTALDTVYIVSSGDGDVTFSLNVASEKTQVHLFTRTNGIQNYVEINLQNSGETANSDGSYTYSATKLDSFVDGDLVEARFYTYSRSDGQVFYPGPGNSVFESITYGSTDNEDDTGDEDLDDPVVDDGNDTGTDTGELTLVWSDEFSGSSVDTSKWSFDIGNGDGGWGNSEVQYYTSNTDNVAVVDGYLEITAINESYEGFNYTSGKLITKDIYEPKYGTIEIRAKVPSGEGVWPAFWMLGSNIDSVGWPACGEVDIMEIFGSTSGTNMGTVHWWADDVNSYAMYGNSASYSLDDFHVYSIEWDEEFIIWYIDGVQFHIVAVDPDALSEFRQNMYMILNLAVGGIRGAGDPSSNTWPQTMYVDYVRVYQ